MTQKTASIGPAERSEAGRVPIFTLFLKLPFSFHQDDLETKIQIYIWDLINLLAELRQDIPETDRNFTLNFSTQFGSAKRTIKI